MDDKTDDCGCCEGTDTETPRRLYNRPGLEKMDYRIGTHPEFKESMLARISSAELPALRRLTARDDSDFGIALCDAAATMLDVLSFYQERIANENFLRTSGERRSILELAKLIGYELAPGVAASTHLAFTLQDAAGLPGRVAETVTIPVGTRVQSVPGPEEQAQSFETVEAIQARPEWNVLKPKMRERQVLVSRDSTIYLHGISTQLKIGDSLLFVWPERESDATSNRWNIRRVQNLVIDHDGGQTVVTLDSALNVTSAGRSTENPTVYALRLRASLFGHNAPDWRLLSEAAKRGYLGGVTGPMPHTEWPAFRIADISDPPPGVGMGIGLNGEYFSTQNLTQRKSIRLDPTVDFDWKENSPVPGVIPGDRFSVRWTGWVEAPVTGSYIFYTDSDDGVRLWVNNQLLTDNWTEHSATENSNYIYLYAERKYDIRLEFYEQRGGAIIKLSWRLPGSSAKAVIPRPRLYPHTVYTVHLDSVYPEILQDSWLVLSTHEDQEIYRVERVSEDSRTAFTLTGKTTRLVLRGDNLYQRFNERLRQTRVFARSDELALGEAPIPEAVFENSVTLDLDQKVEGLIPLRMLILSGTTVAGTETSELLTLQKTELVGQNTKLFFTGSPENRYRRDTVKLYANVAKATHGETVSEVVGSGNAAKGSQRFALRQTPLTHVSATTASGREHTLEVRVNDLLWREVPSLFGQAPKDSVYSTTSDDAGQTTVTFGDGVEGARLPSGQDNIRARYRKGIGSGGNVRAGKLTNLLSRPYSVNEVTNPLAAIGGQDAESGNAARANAPRTVLTLDRAVSVQDYEDFARSFAGIAKAYAKWIPAGPARGIFITVAGEQGIPVPETGDIYRNLLRSLRQYGDVLLPLHLSTYRQAVFRLRVAVRIRSDAESDRVLDQCKAVLKKAFDFNARHFGQMVAVDEVVAVLHRITTIEAVNVRHFFRSDELRRLELSMLLRPRLFARLPEASLTSLPRPAELLLLDEQSLTVEQMS